MKSIIALLIISLPVTVLARHAQSGDVPVPTSTWSDVISRDQPEDQAVTLRSLHASAAATTVVLNSSKFDSGASCTANSWTSVDLSAPANWWHVEDFTGAGAGTRSVGGITFNPVQGSRSMWMGAFPNSGNQVLCSYAALPGYGNSWDQSFCSKACLSVSGGPTANLDVAFKLKFDSELDYDGTTLEYTTDCSGSGGWMVIDGDPPAANWSGSDSVAVATSYAVGPGPVKIRLHFVSDEIGSNEDGLYRGFGVAIDSLSWEGLPVEDFESTALGAQETADWQGCNRPGFGNYLALFKKAGANYEDPCINNLGCYWAALNGSTEFYNCGIPPQPTQRVVPYTNELGRVIANEIWSPVLPYGGTGSDFRLRFTVYRDLPFDNLVFFVWHARTIGANGCPGPWKDRGYLYYGDGKDWAVVENAIGSTLDLNNGTGLQVALGVIDTCPWWCGVLGSGACHSPAPYFDSIKVLRISNVGPQWDVRPVDTFQDTFASDGTLTGTARADAAIDVAPPQSGTIAPGDSAVVLFLADPKYVNAAFASTASGLLNDPTVSTYIGRNKTKNAVYGYFTVQPFSAAKISQAIESQTGGPGSSNRYPWMGNVVIGGRTWAKVRMDYTYSGSLSAPGYGTGTQPRVSNRFNIDINDNLFTPGDTVSYFFGASSSDAINYYSTELGTTTDANTVAANAMEFTIFPAGGYNRGGNILYVDGADGLGNQPFWDGALMQLSQIQRTDRYDVRDPSVGASNRLAGRVANVAAQLNAAYRIILWDTGTLSNGLGDGTGSPLKTNDYGLLNQFLGGLTQSGGVYLSGEDIAEQLNGYPGPGAVSFRSTYMPFTLLNNNHRLAPTSFQISPAIKAWPGRIFTDDFVVFGGCPVLNDFDVLGSSGTSLVQMSYNTASSPNGAVLSNQNGNAHVVLSGFSLANIRDDELNGISDKAAYLYRIIQFFTPYFCIECVGADPLAPVNSLAQNYPNPFNPSTTITFSIAARSHVALAIYDVNGARVRTLANDTWGAGPHMVTWDGRDEQGTAAASGVYFYKLTAGSYAQTRKMVLLK